MENEILIDKMPLEKQLIFQGAEAKLYKLVYNNMLAIEKFRFEKKYRHPDLDYQTRKHRTKSEYKALQIASKNNINAPKPLYVDDCRIIMSYVDGCTLTELYLNN